MQRLGMGFVISRNFNSKDMKKIKDEDLGNALKAIRDSQILKENGGKLPKEYDGYASSIGAAIINSGLLPALSFYTDIHKDVTKVRRFKLLQLIHQVMTPNDKEESYTKRNGLLEHVLKEVYPNTYNSSSAGIGTPDKIKLTKCTNRVLEAAVAVKMAMRNFPHTDS